MKKHHGDSVVVVARQNINKRIWTGPGFFRIQNK